MVRMIDLIKSSKNAVAGNDKDKKPASAESRGRETPFAPPGGEEEKLSFPRMRETSLASPPPSTGQGALLQGNVDESGSIRTPRKLEAKTKNCPYLGTKKDRKNAKDYPVPTNVCYAQASKQKTLLRTTTLPYTTVNAQRQREFCLSSYNRCPVYQGKEKETSPS
ncbi:MAG: hypothetical protein O2807_10305 [bacterium]|nr:hypothetical protein [bacterium]